MAAAVGAGETWSRGIDQVAMGTFWQRGNLALGQSLTMKLKPGAWPAMAHFRGDPGGDLNFGELQLPGEGAVKSTLLGADWAAARHRVERGSGAIEVTVSNLSPAWLVRSEAKSIVLFANGQAHGCEPPSHAAIPEAQGIRTLVRGAPWQGTMAEPYILVWFRDSKGFKDGKIEGVHGTPPVPGVDAPFLVILQNRPARLSLSGKGLELDFGGKPVGFLQVMPLYGVKKLRGGETAGWEKALPADVVARCRRFVRMSRFYPTSCKEEYELGADGAVSVRQSFDYLQIKDDWGTEGEKVAPLPPAFGITLAFGRKLSLPLTIAPNPEDLSYFTPNGPLLVCPGDQHVLRFEGARKYADEALQITPGNDAASQEALAKLNAQIEKILASKETFRWLSSSSNYQFFRFGARNEQVFSLCQALPLLREELREPVRKHAKAMLESYLDEMKYAAQTIQTPSGPVRACHAHSSQSLSGTWESEDLYHGVTLSALWAYAHHTGDWEFVRSRRELLDAMANYTFVRHNWLVGFELDGWSTTGFCHTAQFNALVAYARLTKGLGDEAAYGKAAYLAAKHLLSWYAHFFGTDYLALYMGRDHTSGANRFRHLVNVLPEHLARKTDIIYDTKVTGWVTTHGPSPEGDPTLFLAPWTGIFPLAHDEMHRFWRDHMKGEIGCVWDFFTWLWPETFNQFSADQMNNWGGITPYYQLQAYVLDGAPDWLAENLPWPEVTQDPYYLQSLRAILFAAGQGRWMPLFARP
jgi:hypothetical protein